MQCGTIDGVWIASPFNIPGIYTSSKTYCNFKKKIFFKNSILETQKYLHLVNRSPEERSIAETIPKTGKSRNYHFNSRRVKKIQRSCVVVPVHVPGEYRKLKHSFTV